jgi:anti-sigma regulatory factor (Ser/Thr protein kinase)
MTHIVILPVKKYSRKYAEELENSNSVDSKTIAEMKENGAIIYSMTDFMDDFNDETLDSTYIESYWITYINII